MYREEHEIDKQEWPAGCWHREPDRIEWVDHETGYVCILRRNFSGVLCGYVGVPNSHPAAGKSYQEEKISELTVHGGVTYTGDQESALECKLCSPEAAMVWAASWWIGFDAAHCWDLCPSFPAGDAYTEYRDVDYMSEQVALLARQLRAMER